MSLLLRLSECKYHHYDEKWDGHCDIKADQEDFDCSGCKDFESIKPPKPSLIPESPMSSEALYWYERGKNEGMQWAVATMSGRIFGKGQL